MGQRKERWLWVVKSLIFLVFVKTKARKHLHSLWLIGESSVPTTDHQRRERHWGDMTWRWSCSVPQKPGAQLHLEKGTGSPVQVLSGREGSAPSSPAPCPVLAEQAGKLKRSAGKRGKCGKCKDLGPGPAGTQLYHLGRSDQMPSSFLQHSRSVNLSRVKFPSGSRKLKMGLVSFRHCNDGQLEQYFSLCAKREIKFTLWTNFKWMIQWH